MQIKISNWKVKLPEHIWSWSFKNFFGSCFYEINVCQIMIFRLYIVYNKHNDDKNLCSNQRKIACIIPSARINLVPVIVDQSVSSIFITTKEAKQYQAWLVLGDIIPLDCFPKGPRVWQIEVFVNLCHRQVLGFSNWS